MLDEGQHDVVQSTRQATDEEANRILNWPSFEVKAQRTDDSSEDKMMKVVICCAVEADEVVDMDGGDHVSGMQVETSGHTLQKGKGCECYSITMLQVSYSYLQRIHDGKNLQKRINHITVDMKWRGSKQRFFAQKHGRRGFTVSAIEK